MNFLLFIPVIVFLLMIPTFVDGQILKTHSVSVSEEVFSVDIPVVGTISAVMKYDLDFEIIGDSLSFLDNELKTLNTTTFL